MRQQFRWGLVLLLVMLSLLPATTSHAVPPGDPGSCPNGLELYARYNMNGDSFTGEYDFDSGTDGISFYSAEEGLGLNAHAGMWDSGEQKISAVVLVSGHYQGTRVVFSELFPDGETQGLFKSENVLFKEISHIDFCTGNLISIYIPFAGNEPG